MRGFLGLVVAVGLLGSASAADLSLYLHRSPTETEVLKNYTKAKFEPLYGCYLGAFIDLDSSLKQTYVDSIGKSRRLPEEFESVTGKEHASYFFYLGYGTPLPEDWVTLLAMSGKLVHIALEPNEGLEHVRDDQTLRMLARGMKDTGARILLRFASEMNGDWTAWHRDPKLYREKFRLVAKVMREEAPNVAMVWCPYSTPIRDIPSYYPGDDAVDWVGVNMYNVTYFNQNPRTPARHVHPVDMLTYIYQKYGARKPVMIGEYGTTHFSALEGKDQSSFAIQNIRGLYSALPRKFPRVKAIYYFDGNNLELAHRQNNNYAVTQNRSVLAAYSQAISSDYFLSKGMGQSVTVNSYPETEKAKYPIVPVVLKDGDTIGKRTLISAWSRLRDPQHRVEFLLNGKGLSTSGNDWATWINPNDAPGWAKLTTKVFVANKSVSTKTIRVRLRP
ncbi:MAG: hypothetical protein KIT11_04355 [Fimbriimonadaceae bacterium]|nr:hypothetical protein [Fimbriimonadaceae bacterium]QYK56872.1 MAG: hypothetical protein KF733_05170 [Fimbriimonadaceae bacterium]